MDYGVLQEILQKIHCSCSKGSQAVWRFDSTEQKQVTKSLQLVSFDFFILYFPWFWWS